MGQKTNPIALRLSINREFDSCWYTEKYSHILGKELELRKYFSKMIGSLHNDVYQGRLCFQFFPKKVVVSFFFADLRISSKRKKFEGLKELLIPENPAFSNSFNKKPTPLSPSFSKSLKSFHIESFFIQELEDKKKIISVFFLLFFLRYNKKKNAEFIARKQNFFDSPERTELRRPMSKIFAEFVFVSYFLKKYFSDYPYLPDNSLKFHPFFSPSNSFKESGLFGNLKLQALKISSKYSSAHFLSQFIAKSLEKKMSLKEIYKNIQKEISKEKSVIGMKIQCSGRIGGAEMAKVESRKYGQTSANVFSAKVDFAKSEAYTPYGLIGVQVSLTSI